MTGTDREAQIRALYDAFNARDIDTCLAAMSPDVDWANGWEGGRVIGREAVRAYWERQWAAIDSRAEPSAVTERQDGLTEVTVHVVMRDPDGKLLDERDARHVYEFDRDLVQRMTIDD